MILEWKAFLIISINESVLKFNREICHLCMSLLVSGYWHGSCKLWETGKCENVKADFWGFVPRTFLEDRVPRLVEDEKNRDCIFEVYILYLIKILEQI